MNNIYIGKLHYTSEIQNIINNSVITHDEIKSCVFTHSVNAQSNYSKYESIIRKSEYNINDIYIIIITEKVDNNIVTSVSLKYEGGF